MRDDTNDCNEDLKMPALLATEFACNNIAPDSTRGRRENARDVDACLACQKQIELQLKRCDIASHINAAYMARRVRWMSRRVGASKLRVEIVRAPVKVVRPSRETGAISA